MIGPSSTNDHVDGPRGCRDYEVGSTLDLLNLVMRLAEGQPPTIGHDYPHVYCGRNRENMRIIRVNGQVVSHAGLFLSEVKMGEHSLQVAGLGCMATHPDFRRRGYGSAVGEDVFHRMVELGGDVGWLDTDVPDWYRRLGWEKAGRKYTHYLDRGNVSCLPALVGYEVRCGYQDYLEQMLALHQQHPLGSQRSLDLFKILLDRPDTSRWPQLTTCLATQDEKLGAYAVVSGKEVVEYAGRPEIVAGLLREVFELEDDTSVSTSGRDEAGRILLHAGLSVHTPVGDNGLHGLLAGRGLPGSLDYVGLLRIADLSSLLAKLGLEEIQVEQKGDTALLTRRRERCELTPRQQVKLVFGPERVTDFAADLFPISFYHWPLDYV